MPEIANKYMQPYIVIATKTMAQVQQLCMYVHITKKIAKTPHQYYYDFEEESKLPIGLKLNVSDNYDDHFLKFNSTYRKKKEKDQKKRRRKKTKMEGPVKYERSLIIVQVHTIFCARPITDLVIQEFLNKVLNIYINSSWHMNRHGQKSSVLPAKLPPLISECLTSFSFPVLEIST